MRKLPKSVLHVAVVFLPLTTFSCKFSGGKTDDKPSNQASSPKPQVLYFDYSTLQSSETAKVGPPVKSQTQISEYNTKCFQDLESETKNTLKSEAVGYCSCLADFWSRYGDSYSQNEVEFKIGNEHTGVCYSAALFQLDRSRDRSSWSGYWTPTMVSMQAQGCTSTKCQCLSNKMSAAIKFHDYFNYLVLKKYSESMATKNSHPLAPQIDSISKSCGT